MSLGKNKKQKTKKQTNKNMDFEGKGFLYDVMFYQVLILFKCLKISYVPL